MKSKAIALILAGALVVHGCATQNGSTVGAAGDDVEKQCNPFVLGLLAGGACGLLATGNKRVTAAAVCAAAAVTGCYLYNSYKAEQMRTARQIEDEYLVRNKKLPETATLTAYSTKVDPSGVVQRGNKVEVTSKIVVVPGKSEKNVKVEEELVIVDAVGDQWGKPVRKVANESGQGGEFRTSFKIPVSDGMSQGVYTVQKKLYVNGTPRREDKTAKFQVVSGPDGFFVAMISE